MNWYRLLAARATSSAQFGMFSALAVAVAACGGGSSGGQAAPPAAAMGFTDTALVSNSNTVVGTALTIDANLQNPWGIAFALGSPFWISDNNNNLSTLYSGLGANEKQGVTGSASVGVAIPASAAGVQANTTGQVY